MTGSIVSAEEPVVVEGVETVGVVDVVESGQNTEEVVVEVEPVVAVGLEPLPLDDADCVKCHYGVAVDVDAHGEAHKELSCMDCHEEHPPAGVNIIPDCANCHEGEDHFTLSGCKDCHNPHRPLLIDFSASETVAPACATCHQDKLDELAENPSAHSEQDCNSCHNQHGLAEGQYQTCLDCHEGHTEEMTIADCLKCHPPHSPLNITYEDDIDVALCAACHEDVAESLAARPTAHSEMGCAECHIGEHKFITPCVDCHDQPHDEFMHNKFPECVICHRDPHNLAK